MWHPITLNRFQPLFSVRVARHALRIMAHGLVLTCVAASSSFGNTIVAWGYNGFGQADPPDSGDFASIGPGWNFGLALRQDGSLAGWGRNDYGQINVPAGNDFIAVDGGYRHAAAIRTDGSLISWGWDGDTGPDLTSAPAGNDYAAVSVGWHHAFAMRSDGSLVAWGRNDRGQLDVPPGNDFVALARGAMTHHGLALRADGSIAGWGDNDWGQSTPPPGNDFAAVSVGAGWSLALRQDGSLVAWGSNPYGQTDTPAGTFVRISAGGHWGLAQRIDGSLVAWGWNVQNQQDVPTGVAVLDMAANGATGYLLVPEPSVLTGCWLGFLLLNLRCRRWSWARRQRWSLMPVGSAQHTAARDHGGSTCNAFS